MIGLTRARATHGAGLAGEGTEWPSVNAPPESVGGVPAQLPAALPVSLTPCSGLCLQGCPSLQASFRLGCPILLIGA